MPPQPLVRAEPRAPREPQVAAELLEPLEAAVRVEVLVPAVRLARLEQQAAAEPRVAAGLAAKTALPAAQGLLEAAGPADKTAPLEAVGRRVRRVAVGLRVLLEVVDPLE